MHLTRFALPYSCCCGFSKNEKLLTDCIASSVCQVVTYVCSLPMLRKLLHFDIIPLMLELCWFFLLGLRSCPEGTGIISLDVLLGCLNRYMLAEGLGLSGIVAILFCGIVSAMFFALATMGSTRVIFFRQFS